MKRINKVGMIAYTLAMIIMSSTSIAKESLIIEKEKKDRILRLTEIRCLTENVYHESRSESVLGKIAVAWVTINRVNSDQYPDTVCDVVRDAEINSNGNPKLHQCQFSWYCDGKSDEIVDMVAWYESWKTAYDVFYNKKVDPTYGATMFHASYVKPDWQKHFEKTVRIDDHVFYK